MQRLYGVRDAVKITVFLVFTMIITLARVTLHPMYKTNEYRPNNKVFNSLPDVIHFHPKNVVGYKY